ncbi:hypothetical protein [Nocardia crassostreae]|uniref:hypothetical protein n=1 Tax=Nocardia crassostreae TaxID=53428 RepID=UPI00082DB964|nr:hypothetical protein [Nocardia crassostreae]
MTESMQPLTTQPGKREALWGFVAAVGAIPAGAVSGGVGLVLCWVAGLGGCTWSIVESRRAGVPASRLALAGLAISAVIGVLMVIGLMVLLRGEMPPG